MRRPTGPDGFGSGRRMYVRERRISLRDGVRLRIEDRNEGAGALPLLLLHGFTGSVDAWGETLLDALAATHRVVAIDLLGHGGSDKPAGHLRYGLTEALRDLSEVLDALSIGSAVWIGYSMGGRIALAAGIRCPDRVTALVLESTSPGLATERERRRRRREDDARARRLREHGLGHFVDEWLDNPLFESQRDLPADLLEAARERRLEGSAEGLAGSLRGLGTGSQPSFWDRVGEIDVPTLVLTGERDEKFERIGDRMAEKIPRAVRRSVPGTGHAVHFERPGAWMAEVLDFLETVEG